jgi:predicted dithiol-disulfide oxidoreductase (DUF899 family)
MSLPEIVSREQWIGDRRALLKREKALTKARDELAAERRRLPMVAVTADYRFTAADGSSRTLLDLFEGRRTGTRTTCTDATRRSPSSPARRSQRSSGGTRVFLRVDDRVFHTYSTYARGTEQMGGTHYYLDMTALGRQDDWEKPKGRAESLGPRPTRTQQGTGDDQADRPQKGRSPLTGERPSTGSRSQRC